MSLSRRSASLINPHQQWSGAAESNTKELPNKILY